ncbi:GvpT/GvpP family gas vesicle accessory protein [Peribacillus sp. SCS-26]|uniref:GvpT/GvpP family gas vesicle accessory protein n=1 Tax=Paraperibacillus marinus TaxID=3115295 RepID=UPI00390625C6
MEKTNKENQEKKTNEKNEEGNALKRTLAGGVIGAAVGYLATPENAKKLMEIKSGEKLKSSGAGLGKAVKDKSKKAAASVMNSTAKLFHKKENVPIDGYSNQQEDSSDNETSLQSGMKDHTNPNSEQSSKKENDKTNDHSNDKANAKTNDQSNDKINDRLDRLEKMLAQLSEG